MESTAELPARQETSRNTRAADVAVIRNGRSPTRVSLPPTSLRQYLWRMVIATAPSRRLGAESGARVRFGEEEKAEGAWAGRRLLFLDEKPAFELSFWCGTCQFLFRREDGANERLSIDALEAHLAEGVHDLDDDVVNAFAALLTAENYLPLLLEVQPRLVRPAETDDYFAEEQVATWGLDSFWGLPEYPRTPYYRTYEAPVDADAHLFEFVVPMVPPSWNDPARVEAYRKRLAHSSNPTAVAVATLDVCAPATDSSSTDYFDHWCLTHFLLDGHHKFQASAESGARLQLLSLLSVNGSLADADRVMRVPELRLRPPAPRVPN